MDEEALHLNGSSTKFLAEWAVFKEKLTNHIDESKKDKEELKAMNTKMDSIMKLVNEHETKIRIIAGGCLLILGGCITWIATHFA